MKIRLWAPPAVVLAAAVAMFTFGAQGAAQAELKQDHAHADAIRYASVKGCATKDGGTVPCGDWRLVTHQGKVVPLKDAQVRSLDKKGRPSAELTAPLSVSGDGTRVAYFRKDGRVVVRTFNGSVRAMPKNVMPPRTAQNLMLLKLSDDGAVLAVSNYMTDQTRLYDTASGRKISTLPKGGYFVGFSGDGGEVLTDHNAKLGVHDLTGRLLFPRHQLPDEVADTSLDALHADGRTVAGIRDQREVLLYDLAAHRLVGGKPIKLPKGSQVDELDWTGENQLTLHVSRKGRVTVYEHDVKSGALTVRETYTLLKDTYTYATCGG